MHYIDKIIKIICYSDVLCICFRYKSVNTIYALIKWFLSIKKLTQDLMHKLPQPISSFWGAS